MHKKINFVLDLPSRHAKIHPSTARPDNERWVMDAKTQFLLDWLEANLDKFVAEGIEDSHGRLITVADSLAELTRDEWLSINAAFALGGNYLRDTVEAIAKAYLLEVVARELWNNHLAGLEDEQ